MKLNLNNRVARYFKAAITGLLAFSLVFQIAFSANAAGMSNTAEQAKNTAKRTVESLKDQSDNRALDNGIMDESRNGDDLIGRAQAQVNKVKAAADDNEYRVRGKAREAIEDTKDNVRGTAGSVADKVTSAADDATNSVAKTLDKAGDKAANTANKVANDSGEAGENVIDAVKDFFSGDRK